MISKTLTAAAFTLACLGGNAWAKDTPSQAFISKAVQGNLAEIQAGQMAQQQGQSDGVKAFGKQLEADHWAANQNATAAASALGVTPPTAPSKQQQADAAKLGKLSGAKFDRAFVQHMVADHKKDIAEYTKASKMKSADQAATYASETLPTLKNHLETAQGLAKAR